MEMVIEPSLTLFESDWCVADCCVMDCSFCGADGDGACGIDVW